MLGIGSSSASRCLAISRYIVSVQQPLEDFFLSDAALHFLQSAAFLELGVNLAWIRPLLFSLLRNAIVQIFFRGRQTFLLRNRLDHQIAADLPLSHRPELASELLTLVFRNLVRLGVVLHELLDPAFRHVESVR